MTVRVTWSQPFDEKITMFTGVKVIDVDKKNITLTMRVTVAGKSYLDKRKIKKLFVERFEVI